MLVNLYLLVSLDYMIWSRCHDSAMTMAWEHMKFNGLELNLVSSSWMLHILLDELLHTSGSTSGMYGSHCEFTLKIGTEP